MPDGERSLRHQRRRSVRQGAVEGLSLEAVALQMAWQASLGCFEVGVVLALNCLVLWTL
jgi:hypothetical protein